MHRKQTKKRPKIFDKFKQLPAGSGGIMLCTDVLSRGVDFPTVDWVIHFDLPNSLQQYIHRSGRSGHQVGQKGNSLLLLLHHEMLFVNLCQEKSIHLKAYECTSDSDCVASNSDLDTMTNYEAIVSWIKSRSRTDAGFYEKGMKAFVSYIRNYSASNVLSHPLFESLDVIALINSFGLLKIPVMPELKAKLKATKSKFKKEEGDREIADQHKDQLYKARPVTAVSAKVEEKKNIRQKLKVKRQRMRNKINNTKLQGKRKRNLIEDLELKELNDDARVVKKLKRKQITNKQFEDHFGF
jgi:ATP-dependent RNA helicase DDX55/SPB4